MNTNIQVEDISFDFKINKLFNFGLFINVTSCFKKCLIFLGTLIAILTLNKYYKLKSRIIL